MKTIKKELMFVSFVFIGVIIFVIYNMAKKFEIYDIMYLLIFCYFYIKYFLLKKKQYDNM